MHMCMYDALYIMYDIYYVFYIYIYIHLEILYTCCLWTVIHELTWPIDSDNLNFYKFTSKLKIDSNPSIYPSGCKGSSFMMNTF